MVAKQCINSLAVFHKLRLKSLALIYYVKRESRLSLQFDIYENCINKFIETHYSGIESVLQLN